MKRIIAKLENTDQVSVGRRKPAEIIPLVSNKMTVKSKMAIRHRVQELDILADSLKRILTEKLRAACLTSASINFCQYIQIEKTMFH